MNKANYRQRLPLLAAALCIAAVVVFIFSQSLPDIPASQAQSERVVEIIEPILEPIVGQGNVTNHLVRKLAHFTEFGVLGMALSVFLVLMGCTFSRLLHALSFAVLIALCDETIQLFSQRGSQVQDVWLDIAGAVCGLAFILLLRQIYRLLRRKG